MKLVDNASQAWRWFSIQAMTLAAAIQGAMLALPPEMAARIPEAWADLASMAVLILGIIGRLVDQGGRG